MNNIFGFFAFFWLRVWVDGINKCGWCLAGGRGSWLKCPHQIPSAKFQIPNTKSQARTKSSFLTLPHLLDCLICTRNSVSIVLLLWMMGGWDRWGVVDSYQGVGEGTGGGYYLIVLFISAFVLCSLMSCLFFKWAEHNSCCVCFFIICFLCLQSL